MISFACSFDHVGLTKLLCAYKDEKFIYLIMDYVAGGELFDKIAELESFDEQDAADVTRQLLQALNYLHERGCAHRDIKAENILLVDKDGTQVKIADFGLANTLGNQSKFMSFVGTTPYMAPEVLSGASYGCGVDMWSLGVLTFVMLAGFMPFSGKTEVRRSGSTRLHIANALLCCCWCVCRCKKFVLFWAVSTSLMRSVAGTKSPMPPSTLSPICYCKYESCFGNTIFTPTFCLNRILKLVIQPNKR